MSTDISKYIPLRRIVAFILDECDKSDGDWDKVWVLCFRGMVDMLYDVTWEPLTVRLPVKGNKTVTFPSDCVSWVKIGLLNEKGEVSTLRVNNALTTYKDTNPNRISHLTANINDVIPALASNPFYVNYYYNNQYTPLFGIGGGLLQYGECRVDEKNNVVILPPDFLYDSIIFEYLSSPEKNGDYQVETYTQEAIIAFVKWKLKLGPREEYMAAKIDAHRRAPGQKLTLQKINQVLRASDAQKLLS